MSNEEIYRRAFEAAMDYLPTNVRWEVTERDDTGPGWRSRDYIERHAAMRAAWLLMLSGPAERRD